jgi:hypothetical protein
LAVAVAETVTNMRQLLQLVRALAAPTLFLVAVAAVAVREVLETITPSSVAQAALLRVVECCSKETPTPERQVLLAMMHFLAT